MENLRNLSREIEWSNYARSAYFATVVPGVEIRVSNEVILVTDPLVPMVDGNHAAMLNTTSDQADNLIERIIQHYQKRNLTPTVVLSPSCAPEDLEQRLLKNGFNLSGGPEYWLAIKDGSAIEGLKFPVDIEIHEIEQDELNKFCQIMAASFEMPEEMIPILYHNFSFVNELPGIHNYLACVDHKPVGCGSLFSYAGFSSFGSTGVLPEARDYGVGYALYAYGYKEWKKDGTKMFLIQTLVPGLDRKLSQVGCQRLFTRSYYALE
ncbi:MAG: hypothetical protein P4L50_23215 [Anaerolineaceae bacterium]|nr:hypothetical protein [Anaerolineaceae bacterium]